MDEMSSFFRFFLRHSFARELARTLIIVHTLDDIINEKRCAL
jgi:hypothetical protein